MGACQKWVPPFSFCPPPPRPVAKKSLDWSLWGLPRPCGMGAGAVFGQVWYDGRQLRFWSLLSSTALWQCMASRKIILQSSSFFLAVNARTRQWYWRVLQNQVLAFTAKKNTQNTSFLVPAFEVKERCPKSTLESSIPPGNVRLPQGDAPHRVIRALRHLAPHRAIPGNAALHD